MKIETENPEYDYATEMAESRIEQALLRYDYVIYKIESANEEESLDLSETF